MQPEVPAVVPTLRHAAGSQPTQRTFDSGHHRAEVCAPIQLLLLLKRVAIGEELDGELVGREGVARKLDDTLCKGMLPVGSSDQDRLVIVVGMDTSCLSRHSGRRCLAK
jgi:hypothetical protein